MSNFTHPGDGVGQKSLTSARGAVQQKPPGGRDPNVFVQFGVFHVEQQLAHVLQHSVHASHVFKSDRGLLQRGHTFFLFSIWYVVCLCLIIRAEIQRVNEGATNRVETYLRLEFSNFLFLVAISYGFMAISRGSGSATRLPAGKQGMCEVEAPLGGLVLFMSFVFSESSSLLMSTISSLSSISLPLDV